MIKILGLSENDVERLRSQYGKNILALKEEQPWYSLIFSQFKSPMVYILIFVALISLFLKEYIDSGLIFIVLMINAMMGFYQEYHAQKTLNALRNLIRPKTLVIRNGKNKEIEIQDLVPGDIVIVNAGDKIPADGKIIKGTQLLVNEAILTGEEEAILKNKEEIVFMGTTVLSGRAIVEVIGIGQKTEIGKISKSLAEIKETKTPLQEKLEKFIKNLTWIIVGICVLIFIIGLLHHEPIWQMLRISVVLTVAAIPEGLPIAITVILVLGMRRILKQNGLVKKLLSIETLGSTSVICTDKTGTLTEGIMRVVKTEFINDEKALLAITLDNDQKSNLEVALWNYVKETTKKDPQETFDLYERIDEEPFDSEKKYSQSINKIDQKEIVFMLGAPEIILDFCKITFQEKNLILENIESWASEGLRILGVAFKEEGNLKEKKDYSWLGLVGIRDPIRKEAKEAIEIAQRAGIKVKIITGDYRKTAESIAQSLGFSLNSNNILEGNELEKISDLELKERIEEIVLFTRVSPHQKLKIITALQEKGETVAMTGDGVNDAPALKKANIGVVLGDGSDVAKETGDLILLDNNFKTIVSACEGGRLIFSNIKKVVGYVLSNSFVEIVLIFTAILFAFPAPLTVVQILWIHLICDGPPDIILGFEPKDKTLMRESPKDLREEKILTRPMFVLIFTISVITGLSTLFSFQYFFRQTANLELARTITFATVASISLIYILAFKNLKKSIFVMENFFANKYLFIAITYGFILVFVAVYVPFFNRVLQTVPLNFNHWLLVFGFGIAITMIVELIKLIANKQTNKYFKI